MQFVTVKELHSHTPSVIRNLRRSRGTIVSRFGKPAAYMVAIDEDEVEDLVFSRKPFLRELLAAQREVEKKGAISHKDVKKRLNF